VKRGQLVTPERTPLNLSFAAGEVMVTAGDDAGTAQETITDDVTVDGPSVTVAVNPAYFLEALHGSAADQVTLHLGASRDPFLMVAAGESPHGFRCMLMPVR
jgi:DNA polymerase III sliding clamp (beta) subunit (PCNA family)